MNLRILIDKEQIILRKNTLSVLEASSNTGGKILDDNDGRINFLICPSCFWCASCLSSRILSTMSSADDCTSVAKCPSCIKGNVESIPIADDEEYRFDYDVKRGVTMKFFR
jgi:hypothetical protein